MASLEETWTAHALVVGSSLESITPETASRPGDDLIVRGLQRVPAERRSALAVLDLGCGVGQNVKIASLLGFDARGIEISGEAVRIAVDHGLRVEKGDLRELPYDDEQFDMLTAGGSLEHFPETEVAVKEAYRVLKPGGVLLGNVPYRVTLFVLAKYAQKAAGVWKCGYEKSFTIGQWRRVLADCGFGMRAIEISPFEAGRRRILGGALEFADRATRRIGCGGHHLFFEGLKPPALHDEPLAP